jgi:hypothetical protein
MAKQKNLTKSSTPAVTNMTTDGMQGKKPPETVLTASSAVPAAQPKENETAAPAAQTSAPAALEVVRGQLTTLGEGNDAQTSHIHWPPTASSGVTLGKGYDIGSRTSAQVIADLTAAGMGEGQATRIAAGAGLVGQAAGDFVARNSASIGTIPIEVQRRLLASMLVAYTARARDVATNPEADASNTNARGREVRAGAAPGTFRMTPAQWDALHPSMVEFLTDLIYQGGYYRYDRVARVNAALLANQGNHLAQFRAVAALFQGESAGENSYMDNYGVSQGEARNRSETFYGQDATQLARANTRRNRVRLGYLLQVISALERGAAVNVVAPPTEATPQAPGAAPAAPH